MPCESEREREGGWGRDRTDRGEARKRGGSYERERAIETSRWIRSAGGGGGGEEGGGDLSDDGRIWRKVRLEQRPVALLKHAHAHLKALALHGGLVVCDILQRHLNEVALHGRGRAEEGREGQHDA